MKIVMVAPTPNNAMLPSIKLAMTAEAKLGTKDGIQKRWILPVEPSDFIAMVLPGSLPALPLAATAMPVGDIIKGLLKLVA